MLEKGQKVRCVILDNEGGIGPVLDKEEIYKVQEFLSPEECAKTLTDTDQKFWPEHGGRMELEEWPELHFFGKRFQIVEEEKPAEEVGDKPAEEPQKEPS